MGSGERPSGGVALPVVSPHYPAEGVGSEGTREESRRTHVGVVVIQLHHNAGRLLGDAGWLSKDLNLIEDERLVPGGVQSVLHHHGLLALVQEGDDGVGIWVGQAQGRGGQDTAETVRLVCSGAMWATELEQSHTLEQQSTGWSLFPECSPPPSPGPSRLKDQLVGHSGEMEPRTRRVGPEVQRTPLLGSFLGWGSHQGPGPARRSECLHSAFIHSPSKHLLSALCMPGQELGARG